jgi:hypothetical protein
MMQNILKQDVVEPKEKPEEIVPVETSEEKTKRLRKEARRKLRVSWKPEHELCAIREFTHDPDEENGHDASSVRDVNDVGNEGRMFKQLHKDHKEIVDVEMEEEEKEESFFLLDWESPTGIDFSDLNDPEVEWNKIYKPFGRGELEPDSPEKILQQQREAATLMAVYITRDDIPSRPQSPVELQHDAVQPTTNFGPPDEKTRKREQAFVAPPSLDLDAIARILASNAPTAPQQMPQQVSQPVQPIVQPLAPAQPSPQDWLAALLAAQAPALSQAPNTNIPNTIFAPASEQNNMAANPMAYAGHFGSAQFPTSTSAVVPSVQPSLDFNAMLAQLQSHTGQVAQQQPPPQAAPPVAPNVAELLALAQQFQQPAMYGAYGQAAQQQPQPDAYQPSGHYENPDRKRFRETSEDDQKDNQWNKRPNAGPGVGRGGANFKKWDGDSQRKPKWNSDDNPKKFSLPCKFWPLGKCSKGASCTYRHDM